MQVLSTDFMGPMSVDLLAQYVAASADPVESFIIWFKYSRLYKIRDGVKS